MPPLCKFWQQGYCRNGASCRFDHPGENAPSSNPFGAPNSNTNRFSALNSGGNKPQENPYKITADVIRGDLLAERPPWPLSCYGPGRDAPEQLFGGYPREQSLEEVMVYIKSASNQQQAETEVMGLIQQAEQQNQTALGNLDGAIQFVLSAENKHPNRVDICNQNNNASGVFAREAVAGPQSGFSNPLASDPFSSAPKQNPFGGGTPAFGQPSAMGQKPNPFGAASTTSTPAFGQPSAMGASKPAFGQPSQMGGAAPAFGQPSTLGQKPNPFASAPSGPSGFGQAQTTQSAFGQPSALGQKPNPFLASAPSSSSAPNPFSQPAMTSGPSPFSQPAIANPFAQVTSPQPNDQPMDTSAPTPVANNPFAKPSAPPFGVPAKNPFNTQQSTGFGAVAGNPFAQAQTQAQAQVQAQVQPQAQPQSAPAAAGTANPYGPNSTKQHQPPESYINKAMNGQIMSFNGQQVIYKWKVGDKYEDERPQGLPMEPPVPGVRNSDGSWRKIFFPNGPPPYNQDTEPDPSSYNATIKAIYEKTMNTGRFDGDMPEVPPMREDCIWSF
ncbi:uncharacterized protein GGS22DRAFT_178998 [Annulohypoxylon maeteangense]|uniref:uncharacterized protein n=1 Tax=Annulohypoxylon maeteangense TaxID=1927788 RepID=UPI0020085D3D|nr:uncharacterized protein GGS22DRAFT_178998 [Annulohypoxylon maeteangense]KAI0887063.1 hypothetical protein GGS22DRAFT_178998 [Annulohypoxylon maeteangense]